MRTLAFVMSSTAACFTAFLWFSGQATMPNIEWYQAAIVSALWLGWAVPAVVLLIEECRAK